MKEIVCNPLVIEAIITIIVICFGAWVTFRRSGKERNRIAAETFREEVLSALKHVYPNPVNWDDSVNRKIMDSFKTLETPVAKYGFHLNIIQRKIFSYAWRNYQKKCCDIKYADYHAYVLYKGKNPAKKLNRCVNFLLYFAKKN